MGCFGAILVTLLCSGLSWILSCGLVKLITICFGWHFTWGIATGVWLILLLINLRVTFNSKK